MFIEYRIYVNFAKLRYFNHTWLCLFSLFTPSLLHHRSCVSGNFGVATRVSKIW